SSALLQRFVRVGSRRLQGWRDSEDQSCDQRYRNRERQNLAVNTGLIQTRNVGRAQSNQHLQTPKRKQQTGGAASQREQGAFSEHLPDDSRAARSQSYPNRDLPFPQRRARQKQVGNICTCDQQNKSYRAQ